jgi:hypothetical protein
MFVCKDLGRGRGCDCGDYGMSYLDTKKIKIEP